MPQVWIVEDDEDIREIVLYALRAVDLEAVGFECSSGFFAMLGSKEAILPDLVILDIMLPGANDGLAILKKLRQNPKLQALPIIMLTAKGSEHNKVKGLDLGADDYLTKPFGVMELVSRIKALLRRSNFTPNNNQKYTYQNIIMNHAHRIVMVGNEAVTLTFKEYELLHYLLINKCIVLGRDKILNAVWGYDYEGESRTLDMHIQRLRHKLGESGEHIKTIRNVGYKLGE
jgi:two-component system alkaline phosphatase synthesis response regulator PhoP